jgi:hypothetical protein
LILCGRKLMKRKLWWAGTVAAVLAVFGSANVHAQTTVSANNGDWSDPLNWSAGVPAADTWAAINTGHTLAVTPGAVAGLLDVGGTGNGNLTSAAGTDLTAVAFRVGQAAGAIGNITQTGGTISANSVFNSPFLEGDILIGDAGNGTWTITDGTLTAQDEFLIGFINASEGTLNVEGGTVNAARVLTVGVLGNGKGTLNVSGGIVNANTDLLTSLFGGTTAAVDVSGGTINVTRDWLSGVNAGSVATITQSGGTINVGQHFIQGTRGSSTYTQTGGAVNVTGVNSRMTVAEDHTSATYDLQGGSFTSAHIFLGDFDESHGTLKVSGGSIDLRGNLSVGGALASNAPPAPTGTEGQALNADGTLIVSGPGGTINVAGNLLANPGDNTRFGGGGEHNDSLLLFEVLSGGVSTINVGGVAKLNGAVIDINLLSAAPLGSVFDLISATSISADFVQAAEDVGVFQLSIFDGGNGQTLRATVVPEPTSVAMFVMGIVGLWGSRRTRGC